MGGGSQQQKTNQSSTNKPPKWFEDAAVKSLQVADKINQAGYIPYMGNEVAAFTPMQEQAMQSASDWMSAANGTPRQDAMAGMPKATVDGSGVAGYASAPGLMRNLELLRQRMPKQYDLVSQFGGDLLANPAAPPRDVVDSPWQVGETAARSSAAAAAAGAAGGAGNSRAFGPLPFGLEGVMSAMKGGKSPMSAIMYGLGRPVWNKAQGYHSIYQDQFNQNLLAGKNPFTGFPASMVPGAPAAPAPAAPAPVTNYVNPSKWW